MSKTPPFQECIEFQNKLVMKFDLHPNAVLITTEQPYLISTDKRQTGQIIKTGENVDHKFLYKIITFANKDAAVFGIDKLWDVHFESATMQILYAVILIENILTIVSELEFKKSFGYLKDLKIEQKNPNTPEENIDG